MNERDICGQNGRVFRLAKAGGQHGFDGFELADIIAPTCERCDAWILGDEVQLQGHLFCSVECAWLSIQAA